MFTKDREFYRTFIKLCLALMLEQAVALSVNLADNLMLGAYSEAALSGVAAVNQIQYLFQQIVYAVGNAMIILSSQYWGQKRLKEMRTLTATAFRAEIYISVLLFALVSFFPVGAMKLFSSQPDIISEGVAYLNIVKWSYIFFAITSLLLCALRTVEIVNVALKVSVLALAINVCINYCLISGHFGCPEMGVRGAAIGTLTARIVEFAVVVIYVLKDTKLGFRLRDVLLRSATLTKDYIHVSIRVIGAAIMWGAAQMLQTMILGHMNDSATASSRKIPPQSVA